MRKGMGVAHRIFTRLNGPSEVAVYADETADPAFVAADLLSQAEHGADSQVLLVSASGQPVELVVAAVDSQAGGLPRAEIARKALANSRAFIVRDDSQAMDLLNEYAPEHLIFGLPESGTAGGIGGQCRVGFFGALFPGKCR